jgi:serine/threonine protein kinase
MEFISSDLHSIIHDSDELEIDEEHMIVIMYNLLCCMNFIHTSNIIHRDIKPSNILVQADCGIKLCDFGFGRSLPKTKFNMDKYVQKNMESDFK